MIIGQCRLPHDPRDLFGANAHSYSEVLLQPATPDEVALLAEVSRVLAADSTVVGTAQRIMAGLMSDNWIVEELHGTRIELFVYRRAKRAALDDVQKSSELLLFLDAEGVPVPAPLPTPEMQTYVVEHEGALWQRFPFVHGMYYRGSDVELEVAARGIARMHLALAKYPHVSSFPQKAYGSIDVREWDAAMDVLKGSDVARHVEILQLREKALRAHAEVESLRQSGSLSEQVIHTDLHPQNFLFQDERLNAIIDFGNASWGVLSVDIGMACHRLVRQHVVFCDRSPAVAIPDAVQSFLDAYCSINPSYGPMIGQLPLFMRELLLRKVGDVLLGHAAGRRIEVEAITEITKFGSLIDEVDMIETLGFAK